MAEWPSKGTRQQRRAALAAAHAESGGRVRRTAALLGLDPGYVSRQLRSLSVADNTGNTASGDNTGNTEQVGNTLGGVDLTVAQQLTPGATEPILSSMQTAAITPSRHVEPMTKPITARLDWDYWMLMARVQTELHGLLKREISNGELIGLLLRLAARHAGEAPAQIAAALAAELEAQQ